MYRSRSTLATTLTRATGAMAVLAALSIAACGRRPAPDPTYLAEIEKARAERLATLTAENGWLTVVGLDWLEPGANTFGSGPGAAIVLAAPSIPALAGSFDLRESGAVFLRAEPGSPVTVNGGSQTASPLATDHSGRPDLIQVGRLRLSVIQRGDRLAIRTRDPMSEARSRFRGIEHFPVDPGLRVEGRLDRFGAPREVEVSSAQGPAQRMQIPGVVRFSIGGETASLEPFVSGPGDPTLFFVFRDATAGKETYGAGRFLYADPPTSGSGRVVLDFNRAINPPCAFTPFATCPLPLPQNILRMRIEAGEKVPAGH